MRVRRKFLTSVWCYFTRAQMQTVTTEQLAGDYKGIKCQFDDEAKVEVRKWPFSIAEQDEAQTGSLRASTSSFHVSHYENDVRYRTNLSCFVFVVVLRPFLVTVLHIRGSLSTPWPGDYRWKVAFCLILACLLMYYQVLIYTPPYVRSCTHAGLKLQVGSFRRAHQTVEKTAIPPTGSLWRISRGPSPTISVTFQNCHSDIHTVIFQLCGFEKSARDWTSV